MSSLHLSDRMPEWVRFKNEFTQKQEDALWQYFMDHSKIQHNGYLGILFYIRDKNDFWKRVHARYTGDFQRYDIEEKKVNQEKMKESNNKMYKRAKEIRYIKNGKNITKKIALWIYNRLRSYLFD